MTLSNKLHLICIKIKSLNTSELNENSSSHFRNKRNRISENILFHILFIIQGDRKIIDTILKGGRGNQNKHFGHIMCVWKWRV